MKLEFDITYTDGSTQHVKVRPKHLVAMEDQGVAIGESAKSSYQIAHAASERFEPFTEWLEMVEDIDTISGDDEESRPRPTPEESQTSPS